MWCETFGDSPEYVDLVFDRMADRRFMLKEEKGQTLAATLTGIVYQFSGGDREEKTEGLYLCGLATRPEFRRRGIMGRLIREAETKAAAMGFRFTFLIPADFHLRQYYAAMGYQSIGERRQMKISPVYEKPIFERACTASRKYSILAKEEIPDFADFAIECMRQRDDRKGKGTENGRGDLTIHHDQEQWKVVAAENLLNGGSIIWDGSTTAIIIEQHESGPTIRAIVSRLPELNKVLSEAILAISRTESTRGKKGGITIMMHHADPSWRMIENLIAEGAIKLMSDGEFPYGMYKSLIPNPLPTDININLLLD